MLGDPGAGAGLPGPDLNALDAAALRPGRPELPPRDRDLHGIVVLLPHHDGDDMVGVLRVRGPGDAIAGRPAPPGPDRPQLADPRVERELDIVLTAHLIWMALARGGAGPGPRPDGAARRRDRSGMGRMLADDVVASDRPDPPLFPLQTGPNRRDPGPGRGPDARRVHHDQGRQPVLPPRPRRDPGGLRRGSAR